MLARFSRSEMDDETLWAEFTGVRLSHADWTHRAHIRVAWMFLRRHAIDEAHLLMRVGIIKLNASHDLVESVTRGYHETLTRTWLALVADRQRAQPCDDSAQFFEMHAGSLGKEAPLVHYSRERLFSLEARTMFTPPDLKALP